MFRYAVASISGYVLCLLNFKRASMGVISSLNDLVSSQSEPVIRSSDVDPDHQLLFGFARIAQLLHLAYLQ
jgi:hypothetical protein